MSLFSDHIKTIKEYFSNENYSAVMDYLQPLLLKEPNNYTFQILHARSNLAIKQQEKAIAIYTSLQSNERCPQFIKAEAQLVMNTPKTSLTLLETNLKKNEAEAEENFIAALAAYKSGVIIKSIEYMKRAVNAGFEWEDHIPVDILVTHLLSGNDYHDFEHIYLDTDDNDEWGFGSNNRWFGISLPVYELFASPIENQPDKARLLTGLIDPNYDFGILSPDAIQAILEDLASSESDARFGLEGLKLLNENKIQELAQLILALLLEHLQQFSHLFSLTEEYIKSSQLQDLVRLLPYKIASILLFFYTAANTKETNEKLDFKELDIDLEKELMALFFQQFYLLIKQYNEEK